MAGVTNLSLNKFIRPLEYVKSVKKGIKKMFLKMKKGNNKGFLHPTSPSLSISCKLSQVKEFTGSEFF